MKITFVSSVGEETRVDAAPGQSVMQAAVAANVAGIEAECGGMLTCGTCHVYVREAFVQALDPADGDEMQMLEFVAEPARPNSRLACQIKLTPALDGLVVDVPARQY